MTCVAVATSPVLAVNHSPSLRHRDDPGIFGDVRPSQLVNCLDLLPSSPLRFAGPKLSPFLSSRKSSPCRSPMPPPPSPRVQCSPRTPIGTGSSRSLCACGGLAVYSPSCTCNLPRSASPSDLKWRSASSLGDKRVNNEALSDGKPGLSSGPNVESPSPRLSSSPCSSRFSCAMPPLHFALEAPSPRFGGSHPVFTSSNAFARPSAVNSRCHVVECEARLEDVRGPAFPVSRTSSSEDLFGLDLSIEKANNTTLGSEPLFFAPSSASAGAAAVGRPISPPLKRKRPPKLEIPQTVGPAVPSNFPHVADLCEEALNEMTVEGSYYGMSCKKGRRETLEDTQRAIPDLNGDPGQAFFGVFDGHGGRKAADFAAENLVQKIVDAMETSEEGEGSMEGAVRSGYLATDAEFLLKRVSSGASCVTAIMKDGCMVVANAGDCRAVLCRAGTAEALTRDHRAGREDERQRIENLGGVVCNLTGSWRVQGTLAVTRGIGDLQLKEFISADPDVQKFRITPDCEFLILASDGLWDAVNNQEAVDTARALLQAERRMEAEVMNSQIPQAMASSSLSKEGEERIAVGAGQIRGRLLQPSGDEKNPEMGSESPLQEEEIVVQERRASSSTSEGTDDEVEICMGTMDPDMPDVGFPEPPLPSVGPVAACRRLVEMSSKRGCRDDITVMIVDLQHFQPKTGFASSSSL